VKEASVMTMETSESASLFEFDIANEASGRTQRRSTRSEWLPGPR
jgi:hypothetical protein